MERIFKLTSFVILFGMLSVSVVASTPVVTYGTYFGTAGETATSVVTDPAGNVILVGTTTSQTLPGTAQSFQSSRSVGFPGNRDIFIAKFNPTGKQLLWATFLGGDGDDKPTGVTVDSVGNIILAGTTQSSNFPIGQSLSCSMVNTSGNQQNCIVSPYKVPSIAVAYNFLAKISNDGKHLLYCLSLGSAVPGPFAADNQGGLFVSFASVNPIAILHLNAMGNGVLFSNNFSFATTSTTISALVVDANGNCFVIGSTYSPKLPVTSNAIQETYSNAGLSSETDLNNGFVLELDPGGTKYLYGTYFGPKYCGVDFTSAVMVQNSLYIGGGTDCTALRTTPGSYVANAPNTYAGGTFGFVMKLTPGSQGIDSLTYLGTQTKAMSASQNLHLLTFDGLIELSTPGLGLVSAEPAKNYAGIAFTPQSTWLVGNCYSGACPSGVPSTDAYQTQSDASQSVFLLQQMDSSISVTSVVNAASQMNGAVAPGQLVTISGNLLGTTAGDSGHVIAGFFGGDVMGTQVLFDGISAPVLYAQSSQVNAAIPCSLVGRASTQLVVSYNGVSSNPVTVPLTSAAPGIFTVNGTGTGQAAAFNQDFTLNSPSNPAVRGSAIVFFATGLPAPVCSDGQILPAANAINIVGGINNEGAQVLYAGQAPSTVSGLQQVNLVIPNDSATGPSIYLVVAAADEYSRTGVTIAVK